MQFHNNVLKRGVQKFFHHFYTRLTKTLVSLFSKLFSQTLCQYRLATETVAKTLLVKAIIMIINKTKFVLLRIRV